jgi:hypothetical protein
MQNFFKVELNPGSNIERHECEAVRAGDWIIYHCPKCKDYEHRYNWRTGNVKMQGVKSNIQHWCVSLVTEMNGITH